MRARVLIVSAVAVLLSCSVIAGVPPSKGAPKVGDRAPSFALPDADGTERTLESLVDTANGGKPGEVLLVFYRGHW